MDRFLLMNSGSGCALDISMGELSRNSSDRDGMVTGRDMRFFNSRTLGDFVL
jgi:hypothetical protein